MAYLVILKEVDSYLIERVGGHSGGGPGSLEVLIDGHVIWIDPRQILRVTVRGGLLDELMDEDSDVNDLMEPYKGRLKGGKILTRDKRFGYGDEFWDWWHRVAKPKNCGKDIATKKEADEWHETYLRSKSLIQDSLIYKFVPLLNSKERWSARHSMWIIALVLVRSNNSFKPTPLRGAA